MGGELVAIWKAKVFASAAPAFWKGEGRQKGKTENRLTERLSLKKIVCPEDPLLSPCMCTQHVHIAG